jgi:hypothetical protein
VLPSVIEAQAPPQAPAEPLSGEELYIDRLGCWNCHGMTGGGGAGPAIAETALSLRTFAMYVRLPGGEMPRVSARLASDVDLATIYRWLDGREASGKLLPAELGLIATSAPGTTPAEVTWTARWVEERIEAGLPMGELPDASELHYRVTLHTMVPWVREKTPLADHTVEYQLAGSEEWSSFTTDGRGEALLGADLGFGMPSPEAGETVVARVRTPLPEGRHVLVVEAVYAAGSTETIVGIGTAVLRGS